MANDLMGALREMLDRQLPAGQSQGETQMDEGSLPATIRDVLTRPGAGTNDSGDRPARAGGVLGGENGREALLGRHKRERQAMRERHQREREALLSRQAQEREAMGYAREHDWDEDDPDDGEEDRKWEHERDKEERKREHDLEKEQRKWAHEQEKEGRGRGRGRGRG